MDTWPAVEGLHTGSGGPLARRPQPDLSIPALTTGRASREERRDEEDEQSNKAWPTCYGYREVAHWILLFVGPALSGTP
jgi:hypothetical protein